MQKFNLENIPTELKESGLFCCWQYEKRDSDKPTKVPYSPVTGGKSLPNNPNTFTDYNTALAKISCYDGLGLGIFKEFCAFDLDDCFDTDGTLSPLAEDIVNQMQGSYTEKSPSGNGIRIIFKAPKFAFDKTKYYINNRSIGFEVYVCGATNRFVTLTGNVYNKGGILDKSAELQTILDKYMVRPVSAKTVIDSEAKSFLSDESVIEKAKSSRNGKVFNALWDGDISNYGSHSEADLALCSMLAFWCGRDTAQMDRLYRQSALMRDKWGRAQSGSTYGQITLKKAASNVTEVYSPAGKRTSATEEFSADTMTLKSLAPNTNPKYAWSDIGSGNLFSDWHKDIARYVPERKQWFIFDGKVWRPDTGNLKVMSLCKKLADELMLYALSIADERSRKDYIDFVRKWQVRKNRETILKDAQDVHTISMSYFDNQPELLNCINGTLNLKSGMFYPHNPSDMLTKIASAKYNPQAQCERWDMFISEVMSGDIEKASFLQKALGYALTGDTRFESLFILFGATTRNGKGTCMETFLKITGDYGKTARPESIGMKINNNSSTPTEDIARLAGARFVNISEPDKKLTLSAALVKTLTGNDTVNARFLHENSFDFKPQFKIFVNSNYLPQVTDLTLFSSGRIKIIPFERHFEEYEQDKRLKIEFAKSDNLSGILNWCIEGYKKLQAEGFEMPESVRRATDSYRHDSDKVGLFLEERLIEDGRSEVRTSEVYGEYQRWCSENGFYAENMRNFKASLSTVARIERRRPRSGGEKTTLVVGYKLSYGAEFIEPCTA